MSKANHLVAILGFDSLATESNNLSAIDIVNTFLAFCNSFRALKTCNKVSVILTLPNRSEYLFVSDEKAEANTSREKEKRKANSGCVEDLRLMNAQAIERAQALFNEFLASSGNVTQPGRSCPLSGPIAKALCYANKREKRAKRLADNEAADDIALSLEEAVDTYRILYLKLIGSQSSTSTNSGEYLSLMNVSFAAQQCGIPIDACLLLQPTFNASPAMNSDVTLFQQAADLTNGQFVTLWLSDDPHIDIDKQRGDSERKSAFTVSDSNSLFQFLIYFFLPPVALRSRFRSSALAKPDAMRTVDYRAACVCHNQLVDVGFVCSACLSVYCSFTPVCAVCESHFALQNTNVMPSSGASTV